MHHEYGGVTFTSEMDVEVIDSMGEDRSIARAARVSTGRDQVAVNEKADAGLINAMMRDRHGSPFEHVTMQFRIGTPIFVAREFFRHRLAGYNEISGRYSEMEPKFYDPGDERLSTLTQTGKPMEYNMQPGSGEQMEMVRNAHENSAYVLWTTYQHLLESGVAREVARNILPLSLYTSFYVTMNGRSLMNFFSLRIGERGRSILLSEGLAESADSASPTHPLQEIEDVAIKMAREFAQRFPTTWKAFTANGWKAP